MNNLPNPTPAALYARVSSERQDVGLSVAAQLRALRDYADKNGYVVAREYVDEAESGRVADRPQFRRMLEEATKPTAPFHEILVWKFSRFTRKWEHAVAFKSMLRKKGVRVVSITEHADDSPTGKLMEAIIESVDEFYSENLAQEVTRRMREAASRGFWVSTYAPYGYKKVPVQDGAKKRPRLELDPPADSVVRRIFDMALRGNSSLDITTKKASPAPTATGGSRPRCTVSFPMRRIRAPWYGAPTPRMEYRRYGWRTPFCHSLLKQGPRTCKTPRLNSKRFERIIIDQIRANILTEGNIRELVGMLDEEMDGLAHEQRQKLETIEEELAEVRRRLGPTPRT